MVNTHEKGPHLAVYILTYVRYVGGHHFDDPGPQVLCLRRWQVHRELWKFLVVRR